MKQAISDAGQAGELMQVDGGGAAGPDTRQAIARAESKQQALALLLMSPEMQRR